MKTAPESFLVHTFNEAFKVLKTYDRRGREDFTKMIQLHNAGSSALLRLLSGNTNNLNNLSPDPELTTLQNIEDYRDGGPKFDSSMKYDFAPFVWMDDDSSEIHKIEFSEIGSYEDQRQLREMQRLAARRQKILFSGTTVHEYCPVNKGPLKTPIAISTEPLELETSKLIILLY
ncbi:MAG: hypothetical protein WCJ19_00705 [bacterium]